MQFKKQKRLDLRESLPADIQSAYLRNTVYVQFDQVFVNASERTEPTFDELVSLCDTNCTQVFSAVKAMSNAAHFSFYSITDMNWFMGQLTVKVAIAASSSV